MFSHEETRAMENHYLSEKVPDTRQYMQPSNAMDLLRAYRSPSLTVKSLAKSSFPQQLSVQVVACLPLLSSHIARE